VGVDRTIIGGRAGNTIATMSVAVARCGATRPVEPGLAWWPWCDAHRPVLGA
jgi:hypothetical protein